MTHATFASVMRSLRHAFLVAVGFAALHAWFWSALLTGSSYLAHSDLYEYFLPVFLSPGLIWSTNEFAGFPAFADPQASMWYPVHALFSRGLHWWHGFIIAAYFIASVGAYAYVYLVSKSVIAAVFAGIAWPLCEALSEKYSHLAMLHGFAWFPAMLACLEKLLQTNSSRWLGATALGVAMLILSGHPQGVVYCMYIAGAYGLAGGIVERREWTYYLRLSMAFLLGIALTAAQTLPLAEVSRYTARVSVGFDQFANSFAQQPHEMLSAIFPQIRHEGREAPTYVGIVALAGTALLLVRGRFAWRTIFWLVSALFCFLLGLGDATPLADIAYRIPLYDKFRVVARHLALFSFSAIVLGTCGLAALLRGEISKRRAATALGVVAAIVIAVAGFLPTRPDLFNVERDGGLVTFVELMGSDVASHLTLWLASLATLGWLVWSRRRWPAIALLLVLSILDFGNAQPEAVTVTGMRPPYLMPAALLEPSVHTRWIREELEKTHQRALPIGGSSSDALVVGAFTRRWQVPSAGGYGPLLLNQLARPANMDNNGSIRPTVLLWQDRALDVLAVRLLIVPARALAPGEVFEKAGYPWARSPLNVAVDRPDCGMRQPSRSSFAVPRGTRVRGVALVAHLRCSEDVTQDSVIGSVSVVAVDGQRHTKPLRAGLEVSEAYHGRPELASRVRHRAARVFESTGSADDLQSNYLSILEFDQATEAREIEVAEASLHGWLTVDRLTVITEDHGAVVIDPLSAAINHSDRFREVGRVRTSRETDRGRDEDAENETELVIFENQRAMPRAWMVAEAIALSDADALAALQYSKRPDGRPFDPADTVIVPPGQALSPPAVEAAQREVRIRAIENGRVLVETSSAAAGFLVLSEMWYPGWTASVDGRPRAAVVRANYSVQGLPLEAGRHVVEFRFEPESLRIGSWVSAVSLLGALGLLLIPTRMRDHPGP